MNPGAGDTTQYLNVDFDVTSTKPDQLASILEQHMFVLNRAADFVSFELNDDYSTPDQALREFSRIILELPRKERAMWDECSSRIANIGIQTSEKPHQACFPIGADTVSCLAKIGCGIEITIYARQGQ